MNCGSDAENKDRAETILTCFVAACLAGKRYSRAQTPPGGSEAELLLRQCTPTRFQRYRRFDDELKSTQLCQAIKRDGLTQVRILQDISGETSERIIYHAAQRGASKVLHAYLNDYAGRCDSAPARDFLFGLYLDVIHRESDLSPGISAVFRRVVREYRDEWGNNALWYMCLEGEQSQRNYWRGKALAWSAEPLPEAENSGIGGIDPHHCNRFGISYVNLADEILAQKRREKSRRVAEAKEEYHNRYAHR